MEFKDSNYGNFILTLFNPSNEEGVSNMGNMGNMGNMENVNNADDADIIMKVFLEKEEKKEQKKEEKKEEKKEQEKKQENLQEDLQEKEQALPQEQEDYGANFGIIFYNRALEKFGIGTGIIVEAEKESDEYGGKELIAALQIVHTLNGPEIWNMNDVENIEDASEELYVTAHDILAELEGKEDDEVDVEVGQVVYHFPTQEIGVVTNIVENSNEEVVVALNNTEFAIWNEGDLGLIADYEDVLENYSDTDWSWYF